MPFSKEHGDPAALLEQAFRDDGRKSTDVALLCRAAAKTQILEYLGGEITDTFDNGDFILRMCILEDERPWYAMLLSFGDMITVLEPEELKTRLTETAGEILSLYKKR
jgi:predicted DNA-binding transcriptional regulator YafY